MINRVISFSSSSFSSISVNRSVTLTLAVPLRRGRAYRRGHTASITWFARRSPRRRRRRCTEISRLAVRTASRLRNKLELQEKQSYRARPLHFGGGKGGLFLQKTPFVYFFSSHAAPRYLLIHPIGSPNSISDCTIK